MILSKIALRLKNTDKHLLQQHTATVFLSNVLLWNRDKSHKIVKTIVAEILRFLCFRLMKNDIPESWMSVLGLEKKLDRSWAASSDLCPIEVVISNSKIPIHRACLIDQLLLRIWNKMQKVTDADFAVKRFQRLKHWQVVMLWRNFKDW